MELYGRKLLYHSIKLMEDGLVDERKLLSSAEAIFEVHGKCAVALCAARAEIWKARGDLEAAELWTRIMEQVQQIRLARSLSS